MWQQIIPRRKQNMQAIHDICCGDCPWSKYFHVEQFCSTFFQISACFVEEMLHIESEFAPHACFACHVEQNCPMWQAILLHIVCIIIIYSVLTQNPFCRDLCCFGAKLILSRFMHFCVEQKLIHKSYLWSKNYKYHVWLRYIVYFVLRWVCAG